MNMVKDILPVDDNGQFHGYCEVYFKNGQLWWNGVRVNGKRYGYREWYDDDGSICEGLTGYFLDDRHISTDNEKGYCFIWDKAVLA